MDAVTQKIKLLPTKDFLKKHFLALLFISLIVFAVILCSLQYSKPFTADEFWYLDTAKSLNEVGRPLINFCPNLPPILFWGHPTTYIHYLALFLLIFPESLLRFSGILVFIATIIIFYFLASKLLDKKESVFLAVAIYAFNPLAIQGALLLDIDNTILACAITLFALSLVLKYKNNMTKILIVGSCIGLVFLAKLSVVFIIIGAPVLFFLFFKRKELKWFILSSCLGLAVFLLVWWVLSIISTVSFTSPIEYILLNFVNKGGASISDKIVTILYAGLKQNLLWITLPASLLFISQLKNKRTQLFGVICIIAFLQYLLSVPSAYRFPKYMAAFLPLIIITAAGFLDKIDYSNLKIWKKRVLLFIFPSVIYLALLKDPLAKAATFSETIYVIIVNCIAFLPTLIFKRKKEALLLIYFGVCFYTNIFHLTTDTSTLYNYGDAGLIDTINYLKENILADSNISSYGKEVWYYSKMNKQCPKDVNAEESLKKDCVRAVVIRNGWEMKDAIQLRLISASETHFTEKKTFGDYLVYKTEFCKQK